jgi:hypothetical protein
VKKNIEVIYDLIAFKITNSNPEYADIVSMINECTHILTSISQSIEIIKMKYNAKKDMTETETPIEVMEIGPIVKQLKKSLIALNEQIKFSSINE